MTPTVQTARFESSLTTRSQPTFLAPLVHDRSASHASGVVEGIAVLVPPPRLQAVDPTPVAAQSYYRIQMTSNTFSQYSALVLLSNTSIGFNVRSVQNPFIDQINMEMTSPSTGTATITLIDLFGRSLRRVIQPVNQGLNSVSLYGLGNLPASTYALQIQYGDHLVSQKVVKVDK